MTPTVDFTSWRHQWRRHSATSRVMEWHRSAAVAASIATKRWVRVTANRSLGAYEVFEAATQPPEPEWLDMSLADMIRLAFTGRGRVINDPEHPVVKQLFGRL
jgi:hypothetical protein